MNADISDNRSVFAKHLNNLCTDNNLILFSRKLLPLDSYKHISEAWHTTSWLDHCLTTADAHASLAHMEILYDVSISDHIPVKMVIRSEYIPSTIKCENNSNHVFLSSLTCEEMSLYYEHTDQLLNNIYLPREALMCKNGNCTNSKHIIDISAMYTAIVSALLEASKSLLKHKGEEIFGLVGMHMWLNSMLRLVKQLDPGQWLVNQDRDLFLNIRRAQTQDVNMQYVSLVKMSSI